MLSARKEKNTGPGEPATELGWGLHLGLKHPGSCLTPCAEFAREAQASSVPESRAFAGRAEQEQRLHCLVVWSLPCCFQNGLRVDCSIRGARCLHPEPSATLSCCRHSHRACRNPGVTAFLPCPCPVEWKPPWDPDAERVQAAQSTANAGLLSSPPEASGQTGIWLPANVQRVLGSCFLTWTSGCPLREGTMVSSERP